GRRALGAVPRPRLRPRLRRLPGPLRPRDARASGQRGQADARVALAGEPRAHLVGEGHALPALVVVADEDALPLCGEPPVRVDLVLELEAFRPDPGAARPHLELLTGAQLGAEVDLDTREYEVGEPAEHLDPRLLEEGRVDGVVDVAHRVAVAEPDTLPPDMPGRHASL